MKQKQRAEPGWLAGCCPVCDSVGRTWDMKLWIFFRIFELLKGPRCQIRPRRNESLEGVEAITNLW